MIYVSFSLYDSGNHIFQGLAAGIAVNENGRGLITGLFDCSTIFYLRLIVYRCFKHNRPFPFQVFPHALETAQLNYAKSIWTAALLLSYLIENVIRQNQWGGADIRRGGDPVLRNNFICYGYSDGVVVGERGRGLIEGNHIYGVHISYLYV